MPTRTMRTSIDQRAITVAGGVGPSRSTRKPSGTSAMVSPATATTDRGVVPFEHAERQSAHRGEGDRPDATKYTCPPRADRENDPAGHDRGSQRAEHVVGAVGVGHRPGCRVHALNTHELEGEVVDAGVEGPEEQSERGERTAP